MPSKEVENAPNAPSLAHEEFTLEVPSLGMFHAHRWGPAVGPTLLLHHATGFTARTWSYIARALARDYVVYAFDARGHGKTEVSTDTPSWELYARDLVQVAQAIARRQGISQFAMGIGHSLGGAAMMAAAPRSEGLLSHLALIEPVVLPESARAGRTRFSVRTRMRRQEFASIKEARLQLKEDPIYAAWNSEIFADYINSAFVEEAGGGVRLACSAQLEAKVYELGATPKWQPRADERLSILGANQSRFQPHYDSIGGPHIQLQRGEFGHLVPMEDPELVLRWLRRKLKDLGALS